MRIVVLMAAVLLAAGPALAQETPGDDATRVDDIVVLGRPLPEVARAFVEAVGEAPRGRGLARWTTPVCVGVVNLKTEPAQSLVDHVSMRAEELGIETGEPGCAPNVIFLFSADPQSLAKAMVAADRRAFRLGSRTFNLSADALRHFEESDAPVRWWHTSVPVNADTGERAVRLPGEVSTETGQPTAPVVSVQASRLSGGLRDDLSRILVIVDVRRVSDVSALQLADYLAFVALAQVDPRVDVSESPSVLNVFDNPYSSAGLSEWDVAYLEALYRPGGGTRRDGRTVASGVASGIARTLSAPTTDDE